MYGKVWWKIYEEVKAKVVFGANNLLLLEYGVYLVGSRKGQEHMGMSYDDQKVQEPYDMGF